MREKEPTRVGQILIPKPVSDGMLIAKRSLGRVNRVIVVIVDKMAEIGKKFG